MSLAFSVSALAGLGGFGLGRLLPVVVLPPYGKETLIPGLGFGISGGSIRIHLLAGLLHSFRLLRSLLCQLRRCRLVSFTVSCFFWFVPAVVTAFSVL